MHEPVPDLSPRYRPLARTDAAGRRSRLRQYQLQLLERMQAAKNGAATQVRQLGVLIGPQACLLELTQAGEIVLPPPLLAVPLTQEWYLGLANIRGNLTGVIDVARYWGLPATARGPDARLVTFAAGLGFNCALLVSRVLGLRTAREMHSEDALGQDRDAAIGENLGEDSDEDTGKSADKNADKSADKNAGAAMRDGARWPGARYRDGDGRHWIALDLAALVREPRFLHVGH